MTRFLLNPCGTAGDVHPYIAVGIELRRRGHEVLVLTNPLFQAVIEEQGLGFVPVGAPLTWDQIRNNPQVHRPSQAWRAAMEWGATGTMRPVFSLLRELYLPGRTVVAAPAWSLGARLAREAIGIPLATFVINPYLLRSTLSPPVTPQMYTPSWMPRWMKREQYWFADTFFIEPLLGKPIGEFRRELGLPPVRRYMNGWWFSPDLVLGLFPSALVPPQPDWPCRVQLVGHTTWDPPGDAETNSRLEQFLQSGTPPVCFVPGSVGPGSADYYRVAAESCRILNIRGLILDKSESHLGSLLPSFMAHASYSPLKNILPRCQAIIHSGCMGTAAQGMLAGIPHLIHPRVNDQPDIAHRLQRLGVAEIMKLRDFKTSRLVPLLGRLTRERFHHEKCAALRQLVSGLDASQRIADLLEQLVFSRPF